MNLYKILIILACIYFSAAIKNIIKDLLWSFNLKSTLKNFVLEKIIPKKKSKKRSSIKSTKRQKKKNINEE